MTGAWEIEVVFSKLFHFYNCMGEKVGACIVMVSQHWVFIIIYDRIDSNGVIKISDFGLTEDVYSRNYFRQARHGAKLPLKWMALESIKLGVFSEKSDVVSCFE